jgi:hypothetical protein
MITYKNKLSSRTKLNKQTKQTKKSISLGNNIISEVTDDASYKHFKSLLPQSRGLCHGKTATGKQYKVHIALSKDYDTLVKKTNHYRIIYVHNNKYIIAYIAVKIFKRDGDFMFIHKLCSTGGGYGNKLMNIILEDARKNFEKLGITYLSLTTHNLDLIEYYNQYNPTKTIIVDNPGSKAKNVKKVAYMIWQLSPNMPQLNF